MSYVHSAVEWLKAGQVPHYVFVVFATYAFGNVAIKNNPKLKANGWVEALFNGANKFLLPLFQKVPVLGPLLALLDTPEAPAPAVPPPVPPEAAK